MMGMYRATKRREEKEKKALLNRRSQTKQYDTKIKIKKKGKSKESRRLAKRKAQEKHKKKVLN